MASSYRIYIDESGDEGFSFKPHAGGSSEWFVLSALIVRCENDHKLIESMRNSRKMLGRAEKEPLHFVKLSHQQRLAWVKEIAKLPIRCASVLIHKPSLPNPEVWTTNPYHLYRYSSRLLIERISWFCRDKHDPAKGDGTSQIYFSNRRRMSYDQLRDYWRKLKGEKEARIVWEHINPEKFAAINHDQLAGLQIADCIASAHWQGVSLDRYGNSEPRYFVEMKKIAYSFKNSAIGYGLKFWPDLKELRPSMEHLAPFDGL
jgi:hypothetical protein